MKTVTVIGGGITGLCTMYYLQKQLKENEIPARLVLVEKIRTLAEKCTQRVKKDSSWKRERIPL